MSATFKWFSKSKNIYIERSRNYSKILILLNLGGGHVKWVFTDLFF